MVQKHTPWCLQCYGGGKTLSQPVTSKQQAWRTAASHADTYRHQVTVITQETNKTEG
jgi:hypothetical protein